MSTYPIELTPDDNGTFLVTSASFPELVTFGETEEEALANAHSAVEEAIAARIAASQDIPIASDFVRRGKPYVRIRDLVLIKTLIYRQMRQEGISRAELVRRLGWHRNSVDRLFQIDHQSRIDQLADAARALGWELRTDLVKADAA